MSRRSELLAIMSDGRKKFAILIDPDKYTSEGILRVASEASHARVDFLLYGGSLVTGGSHNEHIHLLKKNCSAPVILFPGSQLMLADEADGLLLLSLISGRNAEMLIGRHVLAAPILRTGSFEILPTGYMLIENGHPTAVSYMSHTTPIPADQDDIAMCTAIAGELLGLQLIYLDAGSGAKNPVSLSMIRKVKENINIPLIVGGGICTPEKAREAAMAGADLVVVGNAIERDPTLIGRIADVVRSVK